MNMNPCQSSNIAALGYDEPEQTLAVQFTNGTLFHYSNVPPETYKAMTEAKSVGSYFSFAIRGKFEGVKVPQEEKVQA